MSHGDHHEPSHGEHHERPEPVRTPIPDPGKGFMVVHKEVREDGNKWITTHQGPNGDFYTIENASTPEANMTLYNENVRNAKLKDAMANGLYRLSSDQLRLTRPAAPSDQFLATLEHAGVSDSFTGSAGGFISYGRGPKGKNEKAAIDERSASIVLSYQARDKALAEGKSPEEAQDIGAQVYNDQESYKETSRVSPGENVQPEIISGDRTAPNPAPPARPIPKSSAYAHPRSTVSAPRGHETESSTEVKASRSKRLRAIAKKAFTNMRASTGKAYTIMQAFKGTKSERTASKQDKRDRAAEVATLQTELDTLLAETSDAKEDIKTRRDMIADMEETRTPEEAATVAEIKALQAELRNILGEETPDQTEVDARRAEIKALKETWSPHEEDREIKIDAIRAEIRKMTGVVDLNQEEIERLEQAIYSIKKAQTPLQATRTALLRRPLYELNDAGGELLKDGKWLITNRLLGRAGLNNQFIDWQTILKPEAEKNRAQKTERKTERADKRRTRKTNRVENRKAVVDELIEPVMRNWNYRATPQDEQFMPADWPGNEYGTPGYQNIMLLTPTQLRNEFGLALSDKQVQPVLDYLNERIMDKTRDAILKRLGKEKLEEFDKLPKAPSDQDAFLDWVDTTMPDLRKIMERESKTIVEGEEFAAFREFLDKRVTL